MEALQTLRCTNCGASLRQPSGSEFVACEYCGYSQRLTDVSRYMETLKADVFNWVRSMVPTGIQMGAQTTDPIARSNIFEHVARPRISQELSPLRTALVRTGSNFLVVPPFASLPNHVNSAVDPKIPLNYAAKFQGLGPLAVTEEQASFINNSIATAETLGYLYN